MFIFLAALFIVKFAKNAVFIVSLYNLILIGNLQYQFLTYLEIKLKIGSSSIM